MLKAQLFLAFFALALAQQTWVGQWYVLSNNSTNYNKCSVPQIGTLVNVTSETQTSLTMTGFQQVLNSSATWALSWAPSQVNASSCNAYWCSNGSIYTVNGSVMATIIWTGTHLNPGIQCSITMSPAPYSWLGNWYVIRAVTSDFSKCDVPKANTLVSISADGKNIFMSGIDQKNGVNTTWQYGWNANQLSYSSCNVSACLNSSVSIVNWVMYGSISWMDQKGSYCIIAMNYVKINHDQIEYGNSQIQNLLGELSLVKRSEEENEFWSFDNEDQDTHYFESKEYNFIQLDYEIVDA